MLFLTFLQKIDHEDISEIKSQNTLLRQNASVRKPVSKDCFSLKTTYITQINHNINYYLIYSHKSIQVHFRPKTYIIRILVNFSRY